MKMTIRSAFLVAAFACGSTLVACSSSPVKLTPPPTISPSPTPSPTAKPTPAAVHYTAIGASDAVGYGASVPCANPPTVAVPTCPGGTGYVPDLAKLLSNAGAAVTLNDLGISGAVIGPDILSTVNMYGALGSADQCMPRTAGVDAYPADFITAELPHLTGTETLVTVFAGGNDTNGIANAAGCMAAASATTEQIDTFVAAEIGAFGADLESLLGSVHAKAPNAKIYVANLPNFALIPVGQEQSVAAQELLSAISVGIDLQVIDPIAASGTPVIDLLCNPQSYVPANFYTDGFHPNDSGYAAFAAAFYAQITATTPAAPSTTCSYIPTPNLKVRTFPSSAFPDFSRGKPSAPRDVARSAGLPSWGACRTGMLRALGNLGGMQSGIDGKRIAALIGDGFEESELAEPRRVLEEQGAIVTIVGIDDKAQLRIRSKRGLDDGQPLKAEEVVADCTAEDFDALLIPGGWSPDRIRSHREVQRFVKEFDAAKKPMFSIGHGAQVLISAQVVRGRTMTGSPSISDDIRNAGGLFRDQPTVQDGHWISTRGLGDMILFNRAILEKLTSAVPV